MTEFVIERGLRRRLAVAGALALLGLGLPWTTAYSVAGYYTPGFCSTTYDADGYGSVSCSPGFVGAGYNNPALPGFTIDVRVFAALMLLAGLFGIRRRSPVLLGIGLVIGGAALVRNPGTQAGQLIWVAALVLAAVTLAESGLLGERAQQRITRLRQPLRRPHGSHPAAPRPGATPGAARR